MGEPACVAWLHRDKLSWGPAAVAMMGVVLLVFFSFSQRIEFTPGTSGFSTRGGPCFMRCGQLRWRGPCRTNARPASLAAHRFVANQVWLALFISSTSLRTGLAYNLGNFLARLCAIGRGHAGYRGQFGGVSEEEER